MTLDKSTLIPIGSAAAVVVAVLGFLYATDGRFDRVEARLIKLEGQVLVIDEKLEDIRSEIYSVGLMDLSNRIQKLEKRTEDVWRTRQMELWAQTLGALNPELKIPEVLRDDG
jgi:hypothetical protein